MLARVRSALLQGLDVIPITIEVDVDQGLPGFSMVGLPDSSVRESRERVFAAIKHAGYSLPPKRITINLAPADHRKEGASLDLPIAIALLAASGQIEIPDLDHWLMAGELSLDGRLRSVRGTLSLGLYARGPQEKGMGGLHFLLPEENTRLPHGIDGLVAVGAHSLEEAIGILSGKGEGAAVRTWNFAPDSMAVRNASHGDYRDIRGQAVAKRAMLVAAAGGHHFVLLGSPGCGKTMLARRLPSLLPALDMNRALEVRRIYDCSGLDMLDSVLGSMPPFRSPHHSSSPQALIGGGARLLPGEVSLAHCGVLFLDEWPEYRRSAIEALRQPLEDGEVHLARVTSRVRYPSRFQLGAAMNPCPCGYLLDSIRACTCSEEEIARYRRRISGPMLDRIDLHVEVPRLGWEEMRSQDVGESSEQLLAKVEMARARQAERYARHSLELADATCNARLGAAALAKCGALNRNSEKLLGSAVDTLGLSTRAFDRVRRVALTLADLDDGGPIREEHIAEALSWRALDRPLQSLSPPWSPNRRDKRQGAWPYGEISAKANSLATTSSSLE